MGNSSLRLSGVLPTFYDPDAVYAEQILAELYASLSDVLFNAVIPYDTSVADALQAGQIAVDYAPHSPASLAYYALANELVSR
jgi:cellulose biosynthesis protein BcsQ